MRRFARFGCGNDYCSSICCMMATKQAMVAGDHVEGLDATIFYMDIRAHGKDFDQYYERARAQKHIHYVKSIPSRIVQRPRQQRPARPISGWQQPASTAGI